MTAFRLGSRLGPNIIFAVIGAYLLYFARHQSPRLSFIFRRALYSMSLLANDWPIKHRADIAPRLDDRSSRANSLRSFSRGGMPTRGSGEAWSKGMRTFDRFPFGNLARTTPCPPIRFPRKTPRISCDACSRKIAGSRRPAMSSRSGRRRVLSDQKRVPTGARSDLAWKERRRFIVRDPQLRLAEIESVQAEFPLLSNATSS